MNFVVASDRDFWGWQNPAGTSPEQPQIATMKEKPSHHPKREIRAQQTRFGGTEERSIKSDPRTVNFISVLPLIQKEPGNGRDIVGKISMPDFQIIYPIVKSTYGQKVIDVSSWRRIKLLNCRDSSDQSRFCVYDQPGDEATLVKQIVSDRILPEYHIDLISESYGVALLEPRPWRRNSVCRPETSTLGVVYAAAQLSRPLVPRLRGETDECMIFGRIGATGLFIRILFGLREVTGVTIWYQSGVPSRPRPGMAIRGFVRQFSQELSVSSVIIPRLSRSGYVTFLLPPYFKQSFHEFLLREIT
ncbi:hypothetical protein DY000_02031010 [Brassica cretica]|uniref:Uncharacterized protein n=1 Tax=Brassica cretica TaxID=69181 RepID=A0ABQ7DRK4_BRACR|nr:hypothetical protein DY000_02031010 [Brassica cretica]